MAEFETIIHFLANNNSDYSLIDYLLQREHSFTETEMQVAPKLLFHKSPEIRYNFIKFIGRVKDNNLAGGLSTIINDDNEKYYIQLEAISVLSRLSDKDEKIKTILKKAVIKLSSHQWQKKIIAKNIVAKDMFDLLTNSLTEVLKDSCLVNIFNMETQQTNKLQLRDSIGLSSYLLNDMNGSIIFNLNKSAAAGLIEKMKISKILGNGVISENSVESKYFFDLSKLTGMINDKISDNCRKNYSLAVDIMPAYFFNRQNIILSEKEDDTYSIKVHTDIGEINIGVISHSKDTSIGDLNDAAQFLKIELISNTKIIVKCKAVQFYIECMNISGGDCMIVENRMLLNKCLFQKILNYYNILVEECKTDRRISAQFNHKLKFLAYLCDDIDIYSQNFVFFKLGQINLEMKERVFQQITTYKYLLKMPTELLQKIILKLSYNELLAIIINSNTSICSKILLSCSEKMRQTLNTSMNAKPQFHQAFVFDAKYKLGKLIKNSLDNDDHYKANINKLLSSVNEI